MEPKISLPEKLVKELNITQVHTTFIGGQKYVFIVDCNRIKRAIKLFKSGFNERDQRELDFYKENSHLEGIPRIVDIIQSGKDIVLVEEYIEGNCLENISRTYERDDKKITALVKDIVAIMTPVWSERKVHRDLKPLNIIIKPDGKPAVLDFGIIKDPEDSTITETGFQPNRNQGTPYLISQP